MAVDSQILFFKVKSNIKRMIFSIPNEKLPLSSMVAGILIGGLILYVYGCKFAFLVIALTAIIIPIIFLYTGIKKKETNPMDHANGHRFSGLWWYNFLSIVMLSETSYGLLYLMALKRAHNLEMRVENNNEFVFFWLLLTTTIAAIMVFNISILKIGVYSFPITALFWAIIGSHTGRFISTKVKLTLNTSSFDLIYFTTLFILGIAGVYTVLINHTVFFS